MALSGRGSRWGCHRVERCEARLECAPVSAIPWTWASRKEEEIEEDQEKKPESSHHLPGVQTTRGGLLGVPEKRTKETETLKHLCFPILAVGLAQDTYALGWRLTGSVLLHSQIEEREVLEWSAFAQCPQLLLYPTAKTKHHARSSAKACMPWVCTYRSFGQNAQRQSLSKCSEVMGSHSYLLAIS